METLTNFWQGFITPNEGLINIIFNDFGIPFIFIELNVSMLLFTTVLNIKVTKKQMITYVLFVAILSGIANYFLPKSVASIINVLSSLLLIKFYFKASFLKSLLSIIIPTAIIILLELLLARIYLLIFKLSYDSIVNIPVGRLSIVLIIYLIIFLLYRFIRRYSLNINILENINKKSKHLLIANFIIAFITIGTQLYLIINYYSNLPSIVIIISMITLITYFFISFYSLIKTAKLELTTLDLEQAKEYNKTLTILHDNIRGFKHDFNNIVTTIGGYVQTEDMQGLKKYYSELLGDCQRVNNLTTLSPEVINNPAIYNLLANKYHLADEKGIKINFEIFMDLNELNIKIYEFTRILGILLDNAIEATNECDEKIINFIIRNDPSKSRQLLIIENTYKNKDVDTVKIFEKGFSTKENNTGFGLWEVNQILRKNNHLSLYTTKDDKFFKQQLEIYNK